MAFVINHPEMGVLFRTPMGFCIWIKAGSLSEKVASFNTKEEAYRLMDSWRGGRPKNAELIEVEVKPGQKPTLEECIAAGLDVGTFVIDDYSPNIHYGKLALEAGYKLPIKVCESGAGFYIGTWDWEGPCTRESVEYFRSKKLAEEALKTGNWTQRGSVKTAFTDDLVNIAKLLAQN